MKKIKLIVAAIALAAVLLVGIVMSVAVVIDKGQEKVQGETPDTVIEEPVVPSGAIEEPSLPIVSPDIGREDGLPLPEAVALDIREKTKVMILEGRYEEAENYVYEAISAYQVEGVSTFGIHLEDIRGDLSGLSQLSYLASFEDANGLIRIVESLSDPFSFVAGALWIDSYDRESLFYTDESLNPYYGTIDSIGEPQKSVRKLSGITEYEAIYEIPVTLDGKELTAIVIDDYGMLRLYSIEANEGTEHSYLTIRETRDMLEEAFGEKIPEENIDLISEQTVGEVENNE